MKTFYFKREKLELTYEEKYDPQLGEKRFTYDLKKTQSEVTFSATPRNSDNNINPPCMEKDPPYTKEDGVIIGIFVEDVAKIKGLSTIERLEEGLDNRSFWERFWEELKRWEKIAVIATGIGTLVLAIVEVLKYIFGPPL